MVRGFRSDLVVCLHRDSITDEYETITCEKDIVEVN